MTAQCDPGNGCCEWRWARLHTHQESMSTWMWTFVTASVHGGAKLQHCTHQTCEVFQCVSHQSSLCDVLICMLSSWMLLLTSSLQTSIARFAKAVHACAKRQCTSACLVIACNEAWRVWQYIHKVPAFENKCMIRTCTVVTLVELSLSDEHMQGCK